jgi:hypothetical protein
MLLIICSGLNQAKTYLDFLLHRLLQQHICCAPPTNSRQRQLPSSIDARSDRVVYMILEVELTMINTTTSEIS